ncbi:MAG TPA: hypothetical protein VNU26_10470 [Mycobacteriales bacterium]|nr:hypothetical protein [Mycobacteriales bacterium]
MVNLAVAVVFLLLLAPVFGAWAGKPWYVQAAIVVFGVPFALLAVMALSSAARPGSVARTFRRLRRR